MNNTGYVLVDSTGLDISESSAQTVDGLYAKLKTAHDIGKMVILTNVKNGENPVSPFPAMLEEGVGITITLGDFSAVVTTDDEVTPVAPTRR